MLAHAVAKYLAAQIDWLVYGSAPNVNTFVDWMPDKPDRSVAVMTQPGLMQPSKLPYDLPGIQILTRGITSAARQPFEDAEAIYDRLTCLAHVTLDAGGQDAVYVVGCTATQSAPVPIGRDAANRPEYSLNFQFHTHNPTTHRPAVSA